MNLAKLEVISCDECSSLVSPPYAVCAQGLLAMKQYFEQLKGGTILDDTTVVPVAVVGNLMAGKTSLIRTLKMGARELTIRKENHESDETTIVFKVERLESSDYTLRFIDYGGHRIYHIAYQLMMKERCVPVVVVNLKEFYDIATKENSEKASRSLCFEWLSHLYLACHHSDPILVLTHRDKLSETQYAYCRVELMANGKKFQKDFWINEKKLFIEKESQFPNLERARELQHLETSEMDLFNENDIFVFRDKEDTNAEIQKLRSCLEKRSKEFRRPIPLIWENVKEFICQQNEGYLSLKVLKKEFPDMNCMTILNYLHNVGEILWFEKEDSLSDHIFYPISDLTGLIEIIFRHNLEGNEVAFWLNKGFKGEFVSKEAQRKMIADFKETGRMDERLMFHLLDKHEKFSIDVGEKFLRAFFIIHKTGSDYIIPHFTENTPETTPVPDNNLKLRIDIRFDGFSLPSYVYHLITAQVLNFSSDLTTPEEVFKDGATVHHGGSTTSVVHKRSDETVTLQVSTPPQLLGPSWKRLLGLTEYIIVNTLKTWKASRPEILVYCSHCIFLGKESPYKELSPRWCRLRYPTDSQSPVELDITTHSGTDPVFCPKDSSGSKRNPTVLKPLKFPCYELTENQIGEVDAYLKKLRPGYSESGGYAATVTPTQVEDMNPSSDTNSAGISTAPDAAAVTPTQVEDMNSSSDTNSAGISTAPGAQTMHPIDEQGGQSSTSTKNYGSSPEAQQQMYFLTDGQKTEGEGCPSLENITQYITAPAANKEAQQQIMSGQNIDTSKDGEDTKDDKDD